MKKSLLLCSFPLLISLCFAQEEIPQEEIAEAPIMMEEDSRPVSQSIQDDQEMAPYPYRSEYEFHFADEPEETIQ